MIVAGAVALLLSSFVFLEGMEKQQKSAKVCERFPSTCPGIVAQPFSTAPIALWGIAIPIACFQVLRGIAPFSPPSKSEYRTISETPRTCKKKRKKPAKRQVWGPCPDREKHCTKRDCEGRRCNFGNRAFCWLRFSQGRGGADNCHPNGDGCYSNFSKSKSVSASVV